MATKSFLKNVRLNSEREAKAFIKALERSDEAARRPARATSDRRAADMDTETIRKLFVSEDKKA